MCKKITLSYFMKFSKHSYICSVKNKYIVGLTWLQQHAVAALVK